MLGTINVQLDKKMFYKQAAVIWQDIVTLIVLYVYVLSYLQITPAG